MDYGCDASEETETVDVDVLRPALIRRKARPQSAKLFGTRDQKAAKRTTTGAVCRPVKAVSSSSSFSCSASTIPMDELLIDSDAARSWARSVRPATASHATRSHSATSCSQRRRPSSSSSKGSFRRREESASRRETAGGVFRPPPPKRDDGQWNRSTERGLSDKAFEKRTPHPGVKPSGLRRPPQNYKAGVTGRVDHFYATGWVGRDIAPTRTHRFLVTP